MLDEAQGCPLQGAHALVVGDGGVGSATATSLAAAGVPGIGLFDQRGENAEALAHGLQDHCHGVALRLGRNDADGYDMVLNATPMDIGRIAPETFVGAVVMKQ